MPADYIVFLPLLYWQLHRLLCRSFRQGHIMVLGIFIHCPQIISLTWAFNKVLYVLTLCHWAAEQWKDWILFNLNSRRMESALNLLYIPFLTSLILMNSRCHVNARGFMTGGEKMNESPRAIWFVSYGPWQTLLNISVWVRPSKCVVLFKQSARWDEGLSAAAVCDRHPWVTLTTLL